MAIKCVCEYQLIKFVMPEICTGATRGAIRPPQATLSHPINPLRVAAEVSARATCSERLRYAFVGSRVSGNILPGIRVLLK